jgi:hypothetical protein
VLESILSHVEPRQVTNDYTVAWEGRRWQIPKEAVRPGLRRSTIRIEARLDGMLMARLGHGFVALKVCDPAAKPVQPAKRPARRYVPAPGQSRWMESFHVHGSEAWKAYREQAGAVSTPPQSPSGLPPRR